MVKKNEDLGNVTPLKTRRPNKNKKIKGQGVKKPTGVLINTTMLRILYQEKGMTTAEFARACDSTERTVYNWLTANSRPSKKNYRKICKALDISPLLLQQTSDQISEMAKHQRIMRFYTRELLGENEAPTYAEVTRITDELRDAADGESAEEETKEADIAIPSALKPSSDTK